MKKGEAAAKILFWLVLITGGIAASVYLDKHLITWQIERNSIAYYLSFFPGILLLVTIINISRNTGRYLARFGHRPDVPRGEINRLVTTGPYAFMRHPMQFGLMMTPLALALISTSLSFILIVAPLEMLLVAIMVIMVEEKQQIKKFGDDYREYMKKVPAFCFKMSCIKELLKPQL